MFMANAKGDSSDLVIIVSIPDLGTTDWHVEVVKGLTNKHGAGQGFLYFCNSRAGVPALWKHWFINVVVIPTIRQYNSFYETNAEKHFSALMVKISFFDKFTKKAR